MKTLRTICVLVYSSVLFQAPAQSFVPQLLDAAQGLPSSECISLEQDYQGHLWVGTTVGISRYNGYAFENFSSSNNNIRFGKVNVIREDDQHLLWIGADNGLFVKTPENVFYKLAGSDSTAQGINDILFLAGGKILLASEVGPLQLPREKMLAGMGSQIFRLTSFQIPEWKDQHNDDTIVHLSLGTDSTLYFSGTYEIFRYRNHSIEKVFENDGTGSIIMSLGAVDAQRFYFYSGKQGLFRGVGKEVSRLTFQDHYRPESSPTGKSIWLLYPPGAIEFFMDSEIVKTQLDLVADGILWTSAFLVDDQGDYWLAAHDGLMKIKRSPFEKIPFTVDRYGGEIYSTLETSDGHFLLGSNRGLIAERTENKISQLYSLESKAETFGMHEEAPGELWYATGYEGLFHRNKNKIERFTEKDGLRNNSNHSFFKTSDGRLFVFGDKGVSQILYDRSSGKVGFKNYWINPSNSQYATVFSAVEAPDKSIWFAGQEGIFKLENDSLVAYKNVGKDLSIADVKMDRNGKVWLAVNGEGIWKGSFDEKGKLNIEEKFDQKEGLTTKVFSHLIVDAEGNVWIGHYAGISVIRNDNVVLNYDAHDGWPFKSYTGLFLYQDKQGLLWAGCSKGVVHFKPTDLLKSSDKPRIFLSASVPVPNHPGESRSVERNQKLELPFDERELTFNFYALDFPNQENLRYAYKLGNGEWTEVGTARSLAFNHLSSGDYAFSVKAYNNKGQVSDEVSMQVKIQTPFWRTPAFIVGVLLVLVISTSLLVRRREKMIFDREQQKKAREVEMISLHRDLAHSRLTALRSQMNPHFIFNALNSIQQFVLQGNVDEASRYLNLFSLLHREILNTSDENFINLQREIDMLNMYIQLEQLRFDDSFMFVIKVDSSIDPDEIRIPPMLIQPFVENAIWHGLMPKAGVKRVEVDFALENDVLICTVRDNGIGRKASAQMKEANGSLRSHKPKGLKLISDRISVLQQRYQMPFTITMIDERDDHGNARGTMVRLALSLETNGSGTTT